MAKVGSDEAKGDDSFEGAKAYKQSETNFELLLQYNSNDLELSIECELKDFHKSGQRGENLQFLYKQLLAILPTSCNPSTNEHNKTTFIFNVNSEPVFFFYTSASISGSKEVVEMRRAFSVYSSEMFVLILLLVYFVWEKLPNRDLMNTAYSSNDLEEVLFELLVVCSISYAHNLFSLIIKGVLLVGPPGTGKTLLARAVAGEAGVPFFHAAGPEFDEILVGQGARRVRDLFKAAKDRAPCVIFIDEIDSVGAKRTNSVLHPYANQTINQLLSEMDGFHQNEGVIVLGATNRRDDLDKALLRPGRFDVEVQVPTPDFTGRKEILALYLGKVITCPDVDISLLARGTTGFTGADLENVVNQAALKAAMDGATSVSMSHLENARDKVLMGPERRSRIPDEEANQITAYHEGGHAIVAYYTKEAHPLHKVTIIPRGPSLGHTAYIPEKERYHITKSQLMAMMDTMMGGRAAEELIFGPDKITSGASSDLKQATSIATHMVKQWGMSEKAGLRTIDDSNKNFVAVNDLSPSTSELLDAEIKRILQVMYQNILILVNWNA
ncbi:hypothetical protein J437_LFUL000699 [Ladona fulva]|uniref:AAA+ ATPase domain-containing protein n=1 Tax=Ladona fulva TaxID=123851 RepID=A0A8K0JUP4_LADFU|nr:hypothetical protein J437_LFUL000699 [Ladona fulva]